jgi:hypothetical protein
VCDAPPDQETLRGRRHCRLIPPCHFVGPLNRQVEGHGQRSVEARRRFRELFPFPRSMPRPCASNRWIDWRVMQSVDVWKLQRLVTMISPTGAADNTATLGFAHPLRGRASRDPSPLTRNSGFAPSNRGSHPVPSSKLRSSLAARPGFEPELGESKSPVLPLHHQAVMGITGERAPVRPVRQGGRRDAPS